MTLRDRTRRRVDYLRLSVTDRCDLRCRYCMPAGGLPVLPARDRLTDDDLVAVAAVAVDLGVRKVRLTGGEPLVHPRIVELASRLRGIGGLERLAVTTNGQRLADLAAPLADAGVGAVNISVDSLRPDRYAAITRGGDLARWRAGLDAALAAGLPVKLNVVLMAGVNDDEIADFADLAARLPVTVRFVEFMPTRGGDPAPLTVPSDRVLAVVGGRHVLAPRATPDAAGPALEYDLAGGAGGIGVIPAVTHRFCDACNRLRVGADGRARGCLFAREAVDLRPLLAAGDRDGLAYALRSLVWRRPDHHHLGAPDRDDDAPAMSRLGG